MEKQIKFKENINISDKLKISIIRAVENAEDQLQKDEKSLELIKKIENEKMNMNEIDDKKSLDMLIDHGMVNRLLNNEVVVSGIGFQALRNIQSKE